MHSKALPGLDHWHTVIDNIFLKCTVIQKSPPSLTQSFTHCYNVWGSLHPFIWLKLDCIISPDLSILCRILTIGYSYTSHGVQPCLKCRVSFPNHNTIDDIWIWNNLLVSHFIINSPRHSTLKGHLGISQAYRELCCIVTVCVFSQSVRKRSLISLLNREHRLELKASLNGCERLMVSEGI